jgi:hypothetical protein
MIPDSVPALPAEEWTINPFLALLSFLELMMMEDADRTLDTCGLFLKRRLLKHKNHRR